MTVPTLAEFWRDRTRDNITAPAQPREKPKTEESKKEIAITATDAALGKEIEDIEYILNKRFDGNDILKDIMYMHMDPETARWIREYASFESPDVVNIIKDYPIFADNYIGSEETMIQTLAPPFCLIHENRLTAPVAFSNLLLALKSIENDIGDIISKIGSITGLESWSSSSSNIGEIKEHGKKPLTGYSALTDAVLEPYKNLYFLKKTGKRFIFPLFGIDSSFNALNNTVAEAGGGLPVIGDAADMLYNLAYMAGGIRSFTNNLGNMLGSTTTSAELAVEEKGKQIAYPASGDTVTTSFTLYNTTRRDAWINNYRFLYLFYFRNLCYRTGVFTYKSPLMYDITIPGVKRLPFCCVSSINTNPIGNIRVLTTDEIVFGKTFTVNVPEAWQVTIQFSSLIGTSANLMHPNVISDITIKEDNNKRK